MVTVEYQFKMDFLGLDPDYLFIIYWAELNKSVRFQVFVIYSIFSRLDLKLRVSPYTGVYLGKINC